MPTQSLLSSNMLSPKYNTHNSNNINKMTFSMALVSSAALVLINNNKYITVQHQLKPCHQIWGKSIKIMKFSLKCHLIDILVAPAKSKEVIASQVNNSD